MERSRTQKAYRSHQHGFSLIELMVTVVVVAILATIAMPAYTNYVIRGKIPDATSALATKRMAMEQYFQDNHSYTGADAASFPCANDTATSQYFNFSCAAVPGPTPTALPANAQTYVITATGKAGMAGFSYTIDQSNVKTSSIIAPAPAGWIAASGSCWITKTGGAC